VAVSDGEQAIAAVDQRTPDIVLADVGMPGRDGYEVAQHIKNTPRLAHIPVVLLTGAFEPIDQARAAAVGCDGVLAKPFEPQLVIGRVKELLARPKRPATADRPLWVEPRGGAAARAPATNKMGARPGVSTLRRRSAVANRSNPRPTHRLVSRPAPAPSGGRPFKPRRRPHVAAAPLARADSPVPP
jgi:CheY-like chemotaxis protein